MARVAVGTIVANNFLPFARVLARSFAEHHPTVPFFVVLADRPVESLSSSDDGFETVLLEDLGIPGLRQLCFGYTRQQVVIAAKPYLLRYLLDRGFATAIFLDADILVLDSLQPLLDHTAAGAIALTPHLVAPLAAADRRRRELNILLCGTYNGGFVGVTSRDPSRRFLDWWADRLRSHCRLDVAGGMHFDQRWLDLVPGMFENVAIVREPGCNVAYWNLPEREHLLKPDGTGGAGCRFFHFSGFQPEHPQSVTRYSERLAMADVAAASPLFARYASLLAAAGYFECIDRPYTFGAFDNGVAIPDVARRIYHELGAQADRFGDPFRTSDAGSYFAWLNQPAEAPCGSPRTVTRLWREVYRSRADLQLAFPDVFAADNGAFLAWVAASGRREHDVAAAFASS